MLWYKPWSENIKKRACRYLLQRYLGNFLEEKLTLDQLSVDLYNGTGTVCDVSLDCDALNELGDAQNWPLEIVDGHMKEISVTIPWSTLFHDDSIVIVNGLSLTVQPKVRNEPVYSMLESMWSSMSSSMQLAAECLKEEDDPQESNPVEGIEMFAHFIDSILSRVKIKFENTKIRVEHVPKNGDRGIALEIHIKSIDYFDEAGTEPKPNATDSEKTKTYVVGSRANKKLKFEGVTLYTDEYPSKFRTMARSLIMEKSMSSQGGRTDQLETSDMNYQSTMSDLFYETRSIISTIEPDPVREIIGEAKSRTESVELTPEEKLNQPDPILFAKLTGEQEVTLMLRHVNDTEGAKIEVNMVFGSLIVFISPRQLHTLIELVDALNQPHLEDTSNIPMRSTGMNMQCKPMRQADFQLIEAQLLGKLDQMNAKPISVMHGWSGPGYEENESENEKFLPMTSAGNLMSESFSSTTGSMSTSISSNVNTPTAAHRVTRNKRAPPVEGNPNAETSHISLTINSVACILLHKDILVPTLVGVDCISSASAAKMQEVSTNFYENLEPFSSVDDFTTANETLDRATGKNHLRLLTSELKVTGSDKLTAHGSQTICDVSAKHLLLSECLYYYNDAGGIEPHGYDLIRFEDKDEYEHGAASSRENIRVTFKQTSKYMRVSGEKKLMSPTTDTVIKCTPFYLDVELTLIERMSATFFGGSSTPASSPTTPGCSQNNLNISLHSPNLNAVLRFPIADLRPGVNRASRRVRPDYLMFQFHNVTISSQQAPSPRPLPTTVSVRCTMLDLYYHENDTYPGTHIARTTIDDQVTEGNILSDHVATTALPTISIAFKPSSTTKGPFDSLTDDSNPVEPAQVNPMTTSMYILNALRSNHPSPFSGKKQAHQSCTKHEGTPGTSQEDEIIVPGTEEEMSEFTSNSIELSSIHLDFILPILSLQLESKQLYEIIYNRINSDLLLWEPQMADQYDVSPLICGPINPAFGLCKGYVRIKRSLCLLDSETDSTSSEEEHNLYHSTYDNKLRKGPSKSSQDSSESHNFCLTLKVGKGVLTIFTPVRDSNKLVVPGQMGELVLEAHNLSMCQVSGLHGKPKTARLCLRAHKTTLYHDSLITIPSEKPPLRVYGCSLPSHLKSTIYPSGEGVIIKDRLLKKDMFTLALRVDPNDETPNFKTICIALGIEQATLRHRGDKGIAWLTQFMDVIDVIDYPVPGYTPSIVASELHVHITDSAIDYRPLYLPIRTVVTLGNFSVSSFLILETNTSCLRFLAQECTLFLMHLHRTKPNVAVPQDDHQAPDVVKDYVCVADVGLFELSIRTEDKTNCPVDRPHVDFSASNNMITLHTCWDSASALCRLVTYAACDGDSQPPADRSDRSDRSSRHTSVCFDHTLEQLVGLEDRPTEELHELSPNEIQHVNDLMEEAMKESPNTTLEEDDLNSSSEKEGVEIFFFPDESNMKKKISVDISEDVEPKSLEGDELPPIIFGNVQDDKVTNIQVMKELGDPTSTPKATPKKSKRKAKKSNNDGCNTDDEYCFIETHTNDNLEIPVVKWIGPGPVPMIDNHFTVPAERADVLKAPKSFPPAIFRYTLLEMSIIWNMFGGSDFRPAGNRPSAKKSVRIEGDARRQGSPTTVKRIKEFEPYEYECESTSSSRAMTAAYRTDGVRWSAGSERVRAARPPVVRDLRSRGGRYRDHDTRVKLFLSKVKFQHEIYPPGGNHASRHTLAINKIEVLDKLACSKIHKLLSQYRLSDMPERPHTHMLVVKAVHLRPDPTLSAQECCLKISLLPLWFNLDQDTLAFLVGYFSKLGSDESYDEDIKSVVGISGESSGSRQTTPTHRPPIMSIASHLRDPPPTPTSLGDADSLSLETMRQEPLMEMYEAERLVSENLIQLEEDFNKLGIQERPTARVPVDTELIDDSPIYFRRVVFSPEVPIRLDYIGKRVDLSAGPVAGLLMGLGQLNCSELTLKRLDYKLGILGLEKLIQWVLHEWLSDIKRHQLPGLLSGIGPMHSLLQLITGIRDLVWLPVEQWRRDGRLVYGLRRGAASFTARTAVAALDITTRLLQLIHATAETAFDMLTPGPTLQLQDAYARRERRRRRRHDPSRHPADIREGVANAYQTVREGFADTAATMAAAARWQHGVGVLRHLPGAAVAPLALAAAGAADVLGGVRASLAPHHAHAARHKWRAPPDTHTHTHTHTHQDSMG